MRVLVLGDYRQTVTVVRSLGRAGHRVTLATDVARSSTALSRYVSDVWPYDGGSPADAFLDQLETRLRSAPTDYVFPVGETPLRHLIGAGDRLQSLATFVNPEPAAVASCFDKRVTYTLASGLGIPTPPWQPFTSAECWRHSALEMGFPVVVKRKDSSLQVRDRKAFIARTPGELDELLDEAAADPDSGSLVLQKFATGTRHNCHVAAADGQLIGYFQQKVIRTDEPDATGLGVAGISVAPSPVLREYCQRLTRKLAYTGVGCIQFLVDEDAGSIALLEFNARLDSTTALPYRLGYDFPRVALDLAAYARGDAPCPEPLTRSYPVGKAYHWLYGDLHAWLNCARHGHGGRPQLAAWARRMLWAALRSHHLTFELLDPLPTLHTYWKKFTPTTTDYSVPPPPVGSSAPASSRK